MTEWQTTGWWRVLDPDGKLWAETSDEQEARDRARPGDRLQQLWVISEQEWRDER